MTTIKQYNAGTSQWETIVVGKQGPVGPGVESGGSEGQYLRKASVTNYDTEWVDVGQDAQVVLGAQIFG